MTLTLAVETATDRGSIAVQRSGSTPVQRTFGHRRHARELSSAVTSALHDIGAKAGDLDRIIVADGPGSFTGLRIGFATVLGMVQARPNIAVTVTPSLMGAAWDAARGHPGPVAAVYDALRGDVFAAMYRFPPGKVEALLSPTCLSLSELTRRAPATPVVTVGDGAVRYADAVGQWTGHPPLPLTEAGPSALALLRLADVAGAATAVSDLGAFAVTYGRPAEAQARWERSHGRALPDS